MGLCFCFYFALKRQWGGVKMLWLRERMRGGKKKEERDPKQASKACVIFFDTKHKEAIFFWRRNSDRSG